MEPVGIDEDEAIAAVQELVGVPNGLAGLDSEGNFPGTVAHRFGTAAAIDAIVLKLNELAFTTDTWEARRGDGSTLGGLFYAGHPVAYTGGPTELTSTSVSSIVVTHPTVASAVYRIWGDIGFSGDSDNQSNFRFLLSHASGFNANLPTISSMHASLFWIATNSGGVVTPDMRFFTPASLAQLPTLSATPISTGDTSGSLRFDAILATDSASTLSMAARLRTTKTSATVLSAYRFFVQRLK